MKTQPPPKNSYAEITSHHCEWDSRKNTGNNKHYNIMLASVKRALAVLLV